MKMIVIAACLLALASLVGACREVGELDDMQGDSGTEDDSDPGFTISLESVAVLIVMDNSISMAEEYDMLTVAAPALMSTFDLRGVGDVRVAVASTDMGLSWGGNPYEDGDGWPGTNPCSADGDDGRFNTCPELSMTDPWSETKPADPNPQMPAEIACLSDLGTDGCGFEQHLRSMQRSLDRGDHSDFLRPEDLLVVLVVSDEDDCSMEDGPGLFATDEIQGTGDGPSRLNTACGNHPEFLYSAAHFANSLRSARGGASNGVLFAAIVGVPPGEVCEGRGDEIDMCLDYNPSMILEEVLEDNSVGQPAVYFAPACTREEGSVEVTRAIPARRLVEIAAEEMPGWSYVASICNADWTPHITAIADMAADAIDEY